MENFQIRQTKAVLLDAMNKQDEARRIMDKAKRHVTATVTDIHLYARKLLKQGQKEKALEVFKFNRQQHPEDTFMMYAGLARGYAANKDKKNALKNWDIALKNLAEDQKPNLPLYEDEIKKLKES